MQARRKKRSKWRAGVWSVLVGCVAFLSVILTMGFFGSADLVLRLEAFAGFFVVGCVFLALSRRSSQKKKREADL
jgi:zinc transporter ZupT